MLVNFSIFFYLLDLSRTLSRSLIFRVFKVWNHFSSFYTQLKHGRICFVRTYPLSFLSFEWNMYKCFSIYEISSWTLRALQCLYLKAKIVFFCSKANFFFSFLLVNFLWETSLYASNFPCVLVSYTVFFTIFQNFLPFRLAPFIKI